MILEQKAEGVQAIGKVDKSPTFVSIRLITHEYQKLFIVWQLHLYCTQYLQTRPILYGWGSARALFVVNE